MLATGAFLLAAALGAAPGTETPIEREAFDAAGARAYAEWHQATAQRLATSGTARDALVAVLFARTAQKHDARGASATLTQAWSRALELGADDALVHWTALTNCPSGPTGCERAAAFERLARLEPDNGAYWRLVLDDALRLNDAPRARAALAQMARAERFDAHFGDLFRAIDGGLAGVPVPPEVRHDGERTLGEDTARAIATFSVLLAHGVPGVSGFLRYCAPGSDPAFESRRDDCIAAAERMAMRSETQIDRGVGAKLWLRAARGRPGEAAARQAALDHEWQSEQLQKLNAGKDFGDEQLALDEIARRRRFGSEVAAMQAELEAAGIPLRAPADYDPVRLRE